MNKNKLLIGVLVVLLLVTGVVVVKALTGSKAPAVVEEEGIDLSLPPVDSSVQVELTESSAKENTVVINVSGLGSKMTSVAYELTYESEGLIKGVNSGSKPIDVAGQDSFEREIYLGTCSRNVCKADTGVGTISLVLEFTDTNGDRFQFSKEYDL